MDKLFKDTDNIIQNQKNMIRETSYSKDGVKKYRF